MYGLCSHCARLVENYNVNGWVGGHGQEVDARARDYDAIRRYATLAVFAYDGFINSYDDGDSYAGTYSFDTLAECITIFGNDCVCFSSDCSSIGYRILWKPSDKNAADCMVCDDVIDTSTAPCLTSSAWSAS